MVDTECDTVAGEIGFELRGDLEGFFRKALGGDLHDSRAIGIEPHFDGDRAVELLRFRLMLDLEQEGRAQDSQLVHRDARRRVSVIEGALFLGEQLAQILRA